MSLTSFYFITIQLLVLIFTVQSAYYAYLYDDPKQEKHCCIVRVRENFCMAKPITRSLVQVDRQCHQSDRSHRHRASRRKENTRYLDQISLRLDVQNSHEVGNKVLLKLQDPLEKEILDNDLICLKSNQHNIHFDKCYVELSDTSDSDKEQNDDHHQHHHMRRKPNRRHQTRHRHDTDRAKRDVPESEQENDKIDDQHNNHEENKNENINHIKELNQPILISEDHGFFIRQKYTVNIPHGRTNDRRSWSWYRQRTRKIRRNPLKYKSVCVNLNDRNEDFIEHILHSQSNNNQTKTRQQSYSKHSFNFGSKLYCENQLSQNKLIGYYHGGEICFYPDNRVNIQHMFTDIIGLSDKNKNRAVLDFIAKNKRLAAELEDDCHGATNLLEAKESKRRESKPHHDH